MWLGGPERLELNFIVTLTPDWIRGSGANVPPAISRLENWMLNPGSSPGSA
jgi:hypothetical protein